LYAAAARWVDEHHLGARFVYYRVGDVVNRRPTPDLDDRTLAHVLDVKDGPNAAWLADELRSRADHVRVRDVDELREHRKAVTRLGQVKTDRRHEKDDRFSLDDRTRWVLGWSNADKVDALVERGATVQARLNAARDALVAAKADADRRDTEAAALRQVLTITSWATIDWHSAARRIDELHTERDLLERGNAELEALQRRLGEVEQARAAQHAVVGDLTRAVGGVERDVENTVTDEARTRGRLSEVATERLAELRTAYGLLESRHSQPATLDDCVSAERDLQRDLSADIQANQDKQGVARERAAKRIAAFRQAWPSDTTELGADVLAGAEYRALRDRITGDDLPRFEAEFKRQLNTNTINDIAGFQAWLDQSAQTIRSRIDTINESLSAIDYSHGTRIRLLTEPTTNQEVRAFRDDLRACTDDALSTDDQYSEERFRRVKAIIERFRGREGLTEVDKRWTELVTDVRSWFVFAASEREADSGVEREHYTDSDGKSGGQKEKLAYTILAASLAYQFGLEWGVPKSKDFRFAVIDEAFGRGSDASTRYALDLFGKLGLQLLVVTPLQKVHVIEPYVSAVGFVENRTGQRSRLQTLTIEEYHAERDEHARVGRAQ
ncbi:MAG TPA: SbcC/MukB-like Walker B domain-containing protein, partial [Ornithinibacter sp.]|nr:SbcC/MukB-like Walker B domain-containing protein [Ornithinibacter sp.]